MELKVVTTRKKEQADDCEAKETTGQPAPEKQARESISDTARQYADRLVAANRPFMLGVSAKLREVGLSYKDYHLLEYLHLEGELRMGDVARHLSVTDAAATGTIDSLVFSSYTKRIPDPNDRRKVIVTLTEAGRAVLEEIHETIQAQIADAMTSAAEPSKEEYEEICGDLRNLLDSM